MLRVRPAGADDAVGLAPRLREADLQEIKALLGEDPRIVLNRGVAWSDPSCAVVDERDRPVALFGVVPDPERAGIGRVWLLGSDELARHRFFVARNSREWVDRLHERYSVLWNFVDARNEVHVRWLKWCGFTFLRLIEKHGAERRPFYEFVKVRGDR